MELIHAIADYLGVPNDFVVIDKVYSNYCFFTVHGACTSVYYRCKTVRNGKFLKKNSIRKSSFQLFVPTTPCAMVSS